MKNTIMNAIHSSVCNRLQIFLEQGLIEQNRRNKMEDKIQTQDTLNQISGNTSLKCSSLMIPRFSADELILIKRNDQA
jgi:hypothetical protein